MSVEAILYHMLVLCVGGMSLLSLGQSLVSGASLSQPSSRLVVLSSCSLHNPLARPPTPSIGPRPRKAIETPAGVLCASPGKVGFQERGVSVEGTSTGHINSPSFMIFLSLSFDLPVLASSPPP